MTSVEKKISFGINLDALIKEKKKIKKRTADKFTNELSSASNQNERRAIKKKMLEGQRAGEINKLNELMRRKKGR
ncbi:MAG: hypothetical protein JW774_08775 [Candidatus Aureabacteria bacterium]|nr:hypothetical protein [Candidatus Auribacterota bacterium]